MNVITFCEGIPQFSEDLREINPKYNNILVFHDLMREAVDSPVLCHLFSKGRHRNASTILLLQNMFPKGKYNTDIARNAQCTVLFRSSSDRKQIDIRAEQIFAKDRSKLMEVYHQVTAKPFGYVMVDSHPQAPFERQVVADIFRDCHCYPPYYSNTVFYDITLKKKTICRGTPRNAESSKSMATSRNAESSKSVAILRNVETL